MIGYLHSFQSMGAVDGPGLRCVVFLQGCPLRCVYCHNPDTWEPSGGTPVTPEELIRRILRFRSYFGQKGGVTVSGGEPLMQGEFVAELFTLLKEQDIHTALDTSGHGSYDSICQVLPLTDLVLCDIKFSTDEQYKIHTGGSLSKVQSFLEQTGKYGIETWIRHVVVPGLTDTPENISEICRLASTYPNIKKIELLPFRKLCEEKYKALQRPFPLHDTPECSSATLDSLKKIVPLHYR